MKIQPIYHVKSVPKPERVKYIMQRGEDKKSTYCIVYGIKSSCCNDPNRDCFKEHVVGIKRHTGFTGLGLQVV